MGGNQLQIFNGILLNVAAVTIEPEEPGGGAAVGAASGAIMGSMLGNGRGSTLGALGGALAGGAVRSKAKQLDPQSLDMDSMRTMPYLICFQ